MATFIQYKTAKGEKRYRFKVYLGTNPATGKRIETMRQGFRTKKEAQAELTKVQLEYQSGKRKEKSQNQTVNDVYQQWFESWKPTVRDSTAYVVEKSYAKHFKKEIGSYRIQKVKAQIIQKLVNQLSEQYKSYRTILKPLKMTFDYEKKENPMLEFSIDALNVLGIINFK